MNPEKDAYHVLILSGSEKGKVFIKDLIPKDIICDCSAATTVKDAVTQAKTGQIDLCFINAPLPDGDAADFARQMAEEFGVAVLLFVKTEEYETAVESIAGHGVLLVEKPNSRRFFNRAVDLFFAMKKRERINEQKLQVLEEKFSELKLVNRAKLVLIQTLKMDEAKAHRYIEKQAMDRRITRREVAEIILSTYEA